MKGEPADMRVLQLIVNPPAGVENVKSEAKDIALEAGWSATFTVEHLIWTDAFRPEYDETLRRKAVTSHFGRHYFVTYWRVDQDINRELIKYMRGDVTRNATLDDRGAIDEYIHTYYENIEDLYLERIYWFNL